jgi:signal transduction histidine kinase
MSSAVAPSADVLRLIAHELRQPLSTIEAIAYYLTLVVPHDDPKVHEQLVRLQQLVEQSNWILTSGLHLADPPSIEPTPLDLAEIIAETVTARSGEIDPPVRLELASDMPPVRFDPSLARILVENLLTLFHQLASAEHPVTIRTEAHPPVLELSTDAIGFRSEAALGAGASLSLESARRMIQAHGGSLFLQVDQATGVRLRVVLP